MDDNNDDDQVKIMWDFNILKATKPSNTVIGGERSKENASSLLWLFLVTIISRKKKLKKLSRLTSELKLPKCRTFRLLLSQLLLGHWGLCH